MEENKGASSLGESEITATEALKRLQSELLPSMTTAADISVNHDTTLESDSERIGIYSIYRILESDKAADIVRILLCLAMSLQQLPGDFEFAKMNLPALPEALQDYHLTSVETLLASDEGFDCTCDGLACMLLQA